MKQLNVIEYNWNKSLEGQLRRDIENKINMNIIFYDDSFNN